MHISLAHISKSNPCFNVKFSTYYFHRKTKTWADFQICISVPLIKLSINKFLKNSQRRLSIIIIIIIIIISLVLLLQYLVLALLVRIIRFLLIWLTHFMNAKKKMTLQTMLTTQLLICVYIPTVISKIVFNWFGNNQMKVNPGKCHLLLSTKKSWSCIYWWNINNIQHRRNSVRY